MALIAYHLVSKAFKDMQLLKLVSLYNYKVDTDKFIYLGAIKHFVTCQILNILLLFHI